MFNKAEILARLQNGDTVDAIAAEMTEALNAAHNDYIEETKRMEEERAKEEQQKKEEDRKAGAKRQAVKMMIDALIDYIMADGGDEDLVRELRIVDMDYAMNCIDETMELCKGLDKLRNLEFKVPEKSINWSLLSKLL